LGEEKRKAKFRIMLVNVTTTVSFPTWGREERDKFQIKYKYSQYSKLPPTQKIDNNRHKKNNPFARLRRIWRYSAIVLY
jgi:hypothetical protein